jgi:hypothetical protein
MATPLDSYASTFPANLGRHRLPGVDFDTPVAEALLQVP